MAVNLWPPRIAATDLIAASKRRAHLAPPPLHRQLTPYVVAFCGRGVARGKRAGEAAAVQSMKQMSKSGELRMAASSPSSGGLSLQMMNEQIADN